MPTPVAKTRHETPMGFRVWRVDHELPMRHAHTHGDVEINFLPPDPRARITYFIAGRRADVHSGHAGIFWGGVPHQLIEHQGPRDGIWITLPLAWFLKCNFPNNFAARLMQGQLFTLPLSADRAAQWLREFDAGPAHHRPILLELEALFARLALAAPARRPAAPRADSLSAIERITSFLALHYQQALSIDDLAAHARLHPKYLMTAFRQATGTTVKTYLLRLRIAHAQRLLATTDMRVLDIAMHSGFGSLSRFYETFDRYVGSRPLVYRRQNQA